MIIDKYKDLNNDQRAIIESVEKFASDNIIPNALKWDKESFFPKNTFSETSFPLGRQCRNILLGANFNKLVFI